MHNLDKKTVQTKINHLQCLNSFKPKDRLAVVDICSDDCILALCEACYNFLKDIIPLKYYQKCWLKSKLMPICFHVRKLADHKVSTKEKRDLLKDPQIGEGTFSLIATDLPALISLLTQKLRAYFIVQNLVIIVIIKSSFHQEQHLVT